MSNSLRIGIVFSITLLLWLFLHEGGHFVIACLLKCHQAVLYHNCVKGLDESLGITKNCFVAVAGVIVNLLVAISFHYYVSQAKNRGYFYLFGIFMAAINYLGLFGYTMMCPIPSYGDMGYVFQALSIPIPFKIAVSIISILFISRVIKWTAQKLAAISIPSKSLTFIILLSTGLFFLLNLPVEHYASIIGPLAPSLSLLGLVPHLNRLAKKQVEAQNQRTLTAELPTTSNIPFSTNWLILLAILILVNRLLVFGLHNNF